MNVIFDFIKQ